MNVRMAVSAALVLCGTAAGATRVERSADKIAVTFDNGAAISFAVRDGVVLGLNSASVDSVALKSETTVQRPVLAQDLPAIKSPMIWPVMRLKDAKVEGERVDISCELFGTSDERALKAFWVMGAEEGKPAAIHRDAHTWPMIQQPEAICDVEAVAKQAAELKGALKPGGTITWSVWPESRNIAGWNWRGWKQRYTFKLEGGQKVGAIRQLGTWEIDGTAAGVTAVNMRYRGLGRIEQAFTAGAGGGVREAWMTSETLAGAVKKAPVISPAVPPSVDVSDRGFALQHRAGAWITRPGRGAGVAFVDFQYRPQAGFASFYERQGNLRASSEVYPGDRCISQTDEEVFAQTDSFVSEPQVYVALVAKDKPLATHEWRTRWQEVDQHVRDVVSAELKFVQYEPLPGVGTLADSGWADYYKGLAKGGAEKWAKKGVRLVAFHNPGWINGRYQGPKGQPGTPPRTGGGVCLVYDWVPATDIAGPWRDAQAAMAKEGMALYQWFGTYNWADAPFAKSVGLEPEHWSVKADGVTIDDNKGVLPHNYLDEKTRAAVVGRLEHTRQEYGFQGFWVDSFQSTGIHRFTRDERHAPQARATWEMWAEWSRKGVGLMAESHAFPGMSCSIEIPTWEQEPWFFQHVWRWYRGEEMKRYSPEELDRLAFVFMANKAWTAPDKSYQTDDNMKIPSFERYAKEYLAALPMMRRSYILAGDVGVLWLGYGGDGEGVVFAIKGMKTPAGVEAKGIVSGEAAAEMAAAHTYRVKGGDLLAKFGVRRGEMKDPRVGTKWEMPGYSWGK